MSDNDRYHYIDLDVEDGINVSFRCEAPAGFTCRQIPKCFQDETCDWESGYHNEGCPGRDGDPVLIDVDYCNVAEWINNSDAAWSGMGKLSSRVTTEWSGDDWIWTIA